MVWEQGPDAGILHLSTHGAVDYESPLFSQLAFTADSAAETEYDGFLYVHEVYNLDLKNAGLVTLSACETQLGSRSEGDEIAALSRAFIYAGTPSVIGTLWKVDDASSSDLMVAFYENLQHKDAKDVALQKAQIRLLRNPRTANPYYWAAFTLTGDYEPLRVVVPKPWWPWILIGAPALILAVAAAIRAVKRKSA